MLWQQKKTNTLRSFKKQGLGVKGRKTRVKMRQVSEYDCKVDREVPGKIKTAIS